MIFIILSVFLFVITPTFQQQGRAPPGVPPQHYQPQPPPPPSQPQYQQQQQYQQPQVPVHQQQYQDYPQGGQPQFQQVPVQHQQVPVQHQQVPVQHQQVPVQQHVPLQQHGEHGAHGGHHGPAPGQLLNAANMAHEKEHLAEHLSVPIDTSKMTDQELQFHYFKMHDADNNNKLDGCELIKSLIHWHGTDNDKASEERVLIQSDEDLETLVDPILKDLDLNKDGFIEWAEFLKSNPAHNPRL